MSERPLVVWDGLLVRSQPTGVGRSILELARAMSACDRGLEFAVLATHPEMFSFLAGLSHWQVWPCPPARGGVLRKALFTQITLPRLLKRRRAHLLHCLQFVVPWRCPCPVVTTVHDLGYLHYPHTVEQPRRFYYRLAVPRSLGKSARIVTNSAATAREVSETFPGIGSRVTATPFGTPSWVYRHQPQLQERPLDAPFLFVGTLEPRKNVDGLLTAYELFLRDCRRQGGAEPPDLVLVGGQGWRDSRLRGQIAALQRKGKLRLAGYCQTETLWDWYCSARALLFPSLHEGFGFPILEAMAAGLPVLTARRGAMQEVAGDAAVLVDPADPADIAAGLTMIHSQSDLRSRLVAAGQERIRVWNWDRTAAATVAVYEEILGKVKDRNQK